MIGGGLWVVGIWWMGEVDSVCGRVWKDDEWMRVGEDENKHFLFPQLGDRSKRATISFHGCLVRYQSGGGGQSKRLMQRKTREHDVASLWHSDRPRS
jgi:hypothetical protein